MMKLRTLFSAALISIGLATAAPALAQEGSHGAEIAKQHWTFSGIFGTYDKNQLQRGCANCHTAHLFAFRNLEEEGGPEFSEAQVKALAATFTINDPDAEGGKRPGLPSDRWPGPPQSAADLKASFGVVPPDLSVMAKARSVESPFPGWLFNYFTAYQEGGPDYIHALLNGYTDPPAGFELPAGKFYNVAFPGHAIGMPKPLNDGDVKYVAPEGMTAPPETVEQYSEDVSAFLMWLAEPHLVDRKAAGFRVIAFLLLLAVLMYLVKNRLWSRIH
jgi:ubiquinol-cytochrome c reductase cytochrome c1 subunit